MSQLRTCREVQCSWPCFQAHVAASLICDPTVGGQVRQGHGAEKGERCGYRAPFMKAAASVCPGVRTSSGQGKRRRSSKQALWTRRRVGVGAMAAVVVVGEVRGAAVQSGMVTGDLD
jgi:hypothetical protein